LGNPVITETEIVAGEVPDPMTYKATRKGKHVIDVRMDAVYPGWQQYFLIVTDAHWDNPHCRRDMFHRFMKQAQERGAGVLFPGDFFCAMQGKYDPRANKSSLRPEHRVDNYIDSLIDTAYLDLLPYKDNIICISKGNHETNITRRLETDLITRLTEKLGVEAGGYTGYIRMMFSRGESNRITHPLFYHHGSGGGSPMTHGLADSMRKAIWVPDATFVVGGHIHTEVSATIRRQRLSMSGEIYYDEQIHITGTTLKDEFDPAGGYHVESGRAPRPIGSTWMRFFYDRHARGNVGHEITRAR
jgi:hypothetical protein